MKIYEYLELKGFNYELKTRPSGDNYIMVCPFCDGGGKHEKSFAINANSGLWNCARSNNCGKSGTFFQLQEMLGDMPKPIDPYTKKQEKNKIYNIPKVIKIPLSDESIKYLTGERKFSPEIIKEFGIFEGAKGEIKIPYYKNNIIVNIKSRLKYRKKNGIWQCKNAEHVLFNRDNVIINKNKKNLLIITEGEYDCMALAQYGIKNVTSVPNGANDMNWIENEWDYLEQFSEIIIIMDSDNAGQGVVKTIVNRIGIWRCKSIKLPYKDVNKCLIENVSPKEILQCFEQAEEFIPSEIKTAGRFCEEVIDIFKNPEKYEGIPTGFPDLDKIIKGWRDGELTVWTGQSGAGKTTLLNQICLYQASIGMKCCIASLELRPARYLKWAIEQALGKNNPTEEEIIKSFEWLDEWLYVLDIQDNVYGSKLFDLFEYTARKYGAHHFVIDSLMMVKLKGEDSDMNQVEFVRDYKKFASKFGVHCHLVAHPRKQESDKDKPGKTDVKGRGEITDVADNVIVVWRNPEDDKEDLEEFDELNGLIIVKKNREFGNLASVPTKFDPNSRRFTCLNQVEFFK